MTLLETITKRATASFNRPIVYTDEEFKEWARHWLATAEEFHTELVAEGLTETANAVRQHIEYQENLFK